MAWQEVVQQILIGVLFPVGSAVAGWAENALRDWKIDLLEWQQLGQTALRVLVPSLSATFALWGFGYDIPAWALPALCTVADRLIMKWYSKVHLPSLKK